MEEVVDNKDKSSFRDKIATVDNDGNRIWMYPKKPKGKYTNYRNYVSYGMLILFFVAPFIKINKEPLILINILERHFVFFGVVFWPQDFHLFLIGMITFVVFVVLFTVVFGRIFCGWVCPQTIFMEMVFRKIEYWIEGDWQAQKKLDSAPLTTMGYFKKTVKHVVFFAISFIISNLFLTYLISYEAWWKIITDNPENHYSGFASMLIFTGIFYFVYSKFREQVCTTICPYGRLQGVLLDRNSIVVAYDYIRGENRGKIVKDENRAEALKGDCVDCRHCIHVCPTGIDIRDGVQMECINCTACIDACNEVMLKVNLPQGLIRYDSEGAIADKKPFKWTKRILAYSAVLVLLLVSLSVLLITRDDISTSILRTPGMLYQQVGEDKYQNLYNVKIINKTHDVLSVQFKIENMEGEISPVGTMPKAKASAITEGAFFIILKAKDIKTIKTKVKVGVYENDKLIDVVNTTFVGPIN